MKYYKFTFSSKIDRILANLIYEAPSYYVSGVTFPGDVRSIDKYAVYDCMNITGATIGTKEYIRDMSDYFIGVKVQNKPQKLLIKDYMCTTLPFSLHMPLCPDEEEPPEENEE